MGHLTRPLVFVHGFKGCHLVRCPLDQRDPKSGKCGARGAREYLTVSQLAGFTTGRIKLPLDWYVDDETGLKRQHCDDLVPDGPLCYALGSKALSNFAGATVYGTFLDWATKAFNEGNPAVIINADHVKLSFEVCCTESTETEFSKSTVRLHADCEEDQDELMNILKSTNCFSFCYDWRRDNEESSIIFERFLQKLSLARLSRPEELPQIVAHSNGGLVAWATMERTNDLLFHSVLLAGVPFGPSLNFLKDLTIGTSNGGLDFRQFAPESIFTFPSVYCFVPTYPYTEEQRKLDTSSRNHWSDQDTLLLNPDGKPVDPPIQWDSAEDWARHNLGIFAQVWRTTKRVLKRHRSESTEPPGDNSSPVSSSSYQTLEVPPKGWLETISSWISPKKHLVPPSAPSSERDDGLFQTETNGLEDRDNVLVHIQNSLDAAKQFRISYLLPSADDCESAPNDQSGKPMTSSVIQAQQTSSPQEEQLPRIAVLVGDEHSTKTKAKRVSHPTHLSKLAQPHAQQYDFFSSCLIDSVDGDGRVTVLNARPPRHPHRQYTLYGCNRTHTSLLDDTDHVEMILMELGDDQESADALSSQYFQF